MKFLNHTMSKHNALLQSGRPLSEIQAVGLDYHKRVESYWTEQNSYRTIHIRIADGYNFEGRRYIVAITWAEAKYKLDYIEEGEPEEDC